jgi:Lon-like ATP-dependent protease
MISIIYIFLINNNSTIKKRRQIIDRENKKELKKLNEMKLIKLNIPLTEKSRPTELKNIVGQENGILALRAAICGPNPQHVIIYGPPGVGKTAAARLVLEEARKNENSPFKKEAKFVEIDATTIKYDERGIADPLIGSVHDPIYQGAGLLGVAGIPQPKPGAVTKAHGGVLFIDEIGELQSIQLNKLLKVLEDRKVFLDSSYYSSEDNTMPAYIKEIFENGLPADFRLIGATTRNPKDIPLALRSRCVEIYFNALEKDQIVNIASFAANKIGFSINEEDTNLIGDFCTNGREAVSMIQLCSGIAISKNSSFIANEDIRWVIENCKYSKKIEDKIETYPQIGVVNGLAVNGGNSGTTIKIEASVNRADNKKGKLKITGIIDEEIIEGHDRKLKRKSTAIDSAQNVITVLNNIYNLKCDNYDIHINIPGGVPVDGPSAGITMATAIYSAINKIEIDNRIAMTGEIGLLGSIKAVGGIKAKIIGAKRAGATKVIIPKENWEPNLANIKDIKVITASNIQEVFKIIFPSNQDRSNILSASD